MPIAVSSLSQILSSRVGGWYTAAGLDASASGAAWLDPLAYSARILGLALADPTTVVDADLVLVTQAQLDQFLDVAEVRALENALQNHALFDQSIGLASQKLSQLRDSIEAAIDRKTKLLMANYGIGLGTAVSGSIPLDFAAGGSCYGEWLGP